MPCAQALRREACNCVRVMIVPGGRSVKPMLRITEVRGRLHRPIAFRFRVAGLEGCAGRLLSLVRFHGRVFPFYGLVDNRTRRFGSLRVS